MINILLLQLLNYIDTIKEKLSSKEYKKIMNHIVLIYNFYEYEN